MGSVNILLCADAAQNQYMRIDLNDDITIFSLWEWLREPMKTSL